MSSIKAATWGDATCPLLSLRPGEHVRYLLAIEGKKVCLVSRVKLVEIEFLFSARKALSFGMRRSYFMSEVLWELLHFLNLFYLFNFFFFFFLTPTNPINVCPQREWGSPKWTNPIKKIKQPNFFITSNHSFTWNNS